MSEGKLQLQSERESVVTEPPRLHGRTLVPVSASMIVILERINSPLLLLARLIGQHPDKTVNELNILLKEQGQIEPEADIETIFCFLHPAAELRALLKRGRDIFKEAALNEIGELHPVIVTDLAKACGRHLAQSYISIDSLRDKS